MYLAETGQFDELYKRNKESAQLDMEIPCFVKNNNHIEVIIKALLFKLQSVLF